MSAMYDCHDKAMEYAEIALAERIRGNPEKAHPLLEKALEWELKAVAELNEPIEPTHSSLHRSAGTLALAQDPPAEIVEELRQLLEQVYLGMRAEKRAR